MTDRRILFKCKSGSDLYGLKTASSDVDYVSVFMPTPKDLLSLQKCEMIQDNTKSSGEQRRNTSEDIDDTSYSLSRYLHLLLQGNPNLTETLFAPVSSIEQTSQEYNFLRGNRERLISMKVYDSFMGFAISQKKKLTYKRERFLQLSAALVYLEDVFPTEIKIPSSTMSEACSASLNNLLKIYKGGKHNNESFHVGLPMKVIYEKIREERDNYGWRLHTESFEKLGYDVKFASHTLRLLIECEELLLTGEINFPFSGAKYDIIMAVKLGQVPLEYFYSHCAFWEDRCRVAAASSILRQTPDFNFANDWLVETLVNSINTAQEEL